MKHFIFGINYKYSQEILIKKGDEINHNCLECKSDYPFEISKNNY